MLYSHTLSVGASWLIHWAGCCLLPTAGIMATQALRRTISLVWQRCQHLPIPEPNYICIARRASGDDYRKPTHLFMGMAESLASQSKKKDCFSSACSSWENTGKEDTGCSTVTANRWGHEKEETSWSHQQTNVSTLPPARRREHSERQCPKEKFR